MKLISALILLLCSGCCVCQINTRRFRVGYLRDYTVIEDGVETIHESTLGIVIRWMRD